MSKGKVRYSTVETKLKINRIPYTAEEYKRDVSPNHDHVGRTPRQSVVRHSLTPIRRAKALTLLAPGRLASHFSMM